MASNIQHVLENPEFPFQSGQRLEAEGDAYAKVNDHKNAADCYKEARIAYRMAATLGHWKARVCLARCYYYGKGRSQSITEYYKWMLLAIEVAPVEEKSALYLEIGKVAEKLADAENNTAKKMTAYEIAIQYYQAANAVYEEGACYIKVGMLCSQEGEREKADHYAKLSADCYKKGIETRDVRAQIALAVCYCFGQGVPKDEGQYLYWLQVAARQEGGSFAGWLLGEYYFEKCQPYIAEWPREQRGMLELKQAISYYRMRAQRGWYDAIAKMMECHKILYERGGVAEAVVEYIYWMKQVSKHPGREGIDALRKLVEWYMAGHIVPFDPIQAFRYKEEQTQRECGGSIEEAMKVMVVWVEPMLLSCVKGKAPERMLPLLQYLVNHYQPFTEDRYSEAVKGIAQGLIRMFTQMQAEYAPRSPKNKYAIREGEVGPQPLILSKALSRPQIAFAMDHHQIAPEAKKRSFREKLAQCCKCFG